MGKKTLANAHCLLDLIEKAPVSVLKTFSGLAECQALARGFDWSQDETSLCASLLDDVVIVREAELRETLVRLALEEHVIAEGAGALALAAGRRVAGKRKCAVVSGGNVDAGVLARLLSEVRPRPPRKPRQRAQERLSPPGAKRALPAGLLPLASAAPARRATAHHFEELPA